MKRVSNGIVLCVLFVVLTAFAPARPASPVTACLPAPSTIEAENDSRAMLPYCHCSWSEGGCATWISQFAVEWEMHINCGGNTYEYQGSGEWGGLCRLGWECPSGSGHNSHNSGNVPHL